MRLPTLLAVVVLCGAPRPAAAQLPFPVVTTLDAAGDVGRDRDVAFGADGRGLVVYVDTTSGGLKVAACADLACTAAAIRTVDADGPVASASVAIGADGRPTIAYQHTPTASVRVARCADAACTAVAIVTLDDLGALIAGTDIAIGADALPLVVYGDAGAGTLKIAHCEDPSCATRTVTTYPDAAGLADRAPAALLGADGVVLVGSTHGTDLRVGHCSNPACTSATFTRLSGSSSPPTTVSYRDPALALGSDGRPVVAYVHETADLPGITFDVQLRRCVDTACAALEATFTTVAFVNNEAPSIGVAPGDLPVVSNYGQLTPPSPKLKVTRCTTPACPFEAPIVITGPNTGRDHAMAVDGLGRALVSYYDNLGGDLAIAWLGMPTQVSIGDVAIVEGNAGTTVALFPVSVAEPTSATVDFATAPGTATSPSDYAAVSGTLTFTPAATTLYVTVSVVGDTDVEPHESFFVNLSNPQGVTIVDGQGEGTILNHDQVNGLRVGDESRTEGPDGATNLFLPVVLEQASATPVTVDYSTADGTATAGVDYQPTSGSLSFAPGHIVRIVTVTAFGDLQPEPDETFFVRLSNPQNGTILDGEGVGTILNDDEFPIPGELRHGTSYVGDLLAGDPPVPDVDDFRIGQVPYASYEVVVDAVSGDAVPLALERRAAGGTVLQSGTPVGTGSAVAMRWIVGGTAPVTDDTVRIAGACRTACGSDDVYRVRAYETTLRATRFNNSGTAGQTTVLLLQNRTDAPVSAVVRFWSAAVGSLIATYATPAPIPPHGLLALNTATVAPLSSGSLTVAHDAPYGGLAGKSVALDVPTGFSFDTPLEPRPR